MSAVTTENKIKDNFLRPFTEFSLNGSEQIRIAGNQWLSQMDFPSVKNEEWKYTRLGALTRSVFSQGRPDDGITISPFVPEGDFHLLVFVNGFYSEKLSRPAGIERFFLDIVNDLSLTLSDQNTLPKSIFSAINAAYHSGGVSLNLTESIPDPVLVLFVQTEDAATSQIRNRIRIAKGVKATVGFSFVSMQNGSGFTNVDTGIELAENSGFFLDILQRDNAETFHINNTTVSQKRDSRFSVNTISLGGRLIRNDLEIISEGENTETFLSGLTYGKGSRHVDNHTLMDHTMPNCFSDELYKNVLDDNSTGVFNGKVFVRRDAQKINAFQSNKNVLLSENALMNAKPELEIYADDVKCSHGSTTGQMDEEALFYLRSRGISEDKARKLMIHAFSEEVLGRMHIPGLKKQAEELLTEIES